MHKKIRQIAIGIFIFTLCVGWARFAQAGEPLDLVRAAVDKAIQTLKDPKLQSQDKKRSALSA
jgi:ABC-type transporter MlaC component